MGQVSILLKKNENKFITHYLSLTGSRVQDSTAISGRLFLIVLNWQVI
jgi:hypothetical protein